METLQVEVIDAQRAGDDLARAGVHDFKGTNTPHSIAAGGDCMRMVTRGGSCTFVARREANTLWIDGAASSGGSGFAHIGLELAETTARQVQCTRVAFETARPGLVKLAKRHGYRIAGFIMEKELP